jgi:hypothetical protein
MSSRDVETARQEAMISACEANPQDRSGDTEQTQPKRRDDKMAKSTQCIGIDVLESESLSEKISGEKVEGVSTSIVLETTETWSFVYKQLARQLEYYFSEKNLSKDTYMLTLQGLNDGCVPLSIIANFSMVKRLVMPIAAAIDEQGRQAAVEEAVRNHSSLLTIHSVDTKTGLRVGSESDQTTNMAQQILAVSTVDDKPIAFRQSPPQSSTVVNTVVLRDVIDGVTPEDINDLFKNEKFPTVKSIQPDIANCW